MAIGTSRQRISRDDLQAAFDRMLGEGESAIRAAVPQAAVVGGAVALALVAVAYVAGRRRGRKRTAVLEVRRI
ncbi:MAG TPA: hypothetical protein VGL60_07415 [Acidimicrobiales bacterium]|jgi:hypothetical protein